MKIFFIAILMILHCFTNAQNHSPEIYNEVNPVKDSLSKVYQYVEYCHHWDYHFIVKSNGKYGVVNIDYDTVCHFVYDSLFDIESYGEDSLSLGAGLNRKWGCLNKKGTVGIPLVYDNPVMFYEYPSAAVVKYKGKFGVINTSNFNCLPFDISEFISLTSSRGEDVPWLCNLERQYIKKSEYAHPQALIRRDSVWTGIKYDGEVYTGGAFDGYSKHDHVYSEIELIYINKGVCFILAKDMNGKMGVLDRNLNVVQPFVFNDIKLKMFFDKHNVMKGVFDGKQRYLDYRGRFVTRKGKMKDNSKMR